MTKSGWIANQNASTSLDFTFAAGDATGKTSHDRSGLGTQVIKRDEADLQINLDPKGYEAISGTTRVRAYRHWQIINSDAGNIMVEPDYHWSVLAGDANFETVNGGNTTANWADVTPGTQDSVLAVYYDSVNVSTASVKDGATTFASSSHGGVFPATNPSRVGVIVVGGTGVTHGTADADVKYNIASGASTTRSADWDYNYDTWFYGAAETDPTLDFAVNATGNVKVDYAFVTANDAMQILKTDYSDATAGEDGRYSIPLKDFQEIGNGKGGTVIIRMTDSTGVSYRLVRVAQVAITAENITNPGEPVMAGDQVKLSFDGMFRAVNKISGIFNPTTFKPTYYYGDTKFEGTLGQYQRMDNASVTVTIPADLEFAEGAETADCTLTNGYTYGSMYSAANPFAFLYGMTDNGVGTNFNAVTVNYYLNHYADVTIQVAQKVTFDVKLNTKDNDGASVDGVTAVVKDKDGDAITANENGTYTLGYGTYTYTLSKDGYVTVRGSFTVGSADADKLVDGILNIDTVVMPKAGDNAWDGTTTTEPAKDADGNYLIGTAAELAWFAANGSNANAKLTADIELAGNAWTPLNKFYGIFDGQGHVIKNLYINSTSYPVGLFGYVKTGASVKNLGVTGNVTSTNKNYGQAGGIAGYLEDNAAIENCFSAVNVTCGKYGGGIAGYSDSGSVITNCYATGTITTISANECYLGGICGSYYNQYAGAKLTNCYSTATVIGTGGNAAYLGGLSPVSNESYFVNSYYLEGTVSKASPKYGITGKGTAKTADELKALASTLGAAFVDDSGNINNGYPVLAWQLPAPVTSAVSFTAQMAGGFLMAPQYNVEVTSNLAESYGFTDQVSYTDAVSPLDVLVKAHELIFEDAFTPETASELLKVSSNGMISKIFGADSLQGFFFVNNAYPNDGTTAWGGYNGYVINNMPLQDGDCVEFFVLQDSGSRDNYAWFLQDGTYTRSLTATAGQDVTLTVQGVTVMDTYKYKDEAALVAAGKTLSGAQLALVNAETGAVSKIDGAVTGEDGTVTFRIAQAGTYRLTAFMPAADIENGSIPIVMTLSTITVEEAPIQLGDVNQDGEVTNVDAAMVYAAYNSTLELTEAQIALADVNGDGEITNVDAAMIYAYYNGTLDSFPAAK